MFLCVIPNALRGNIVIGNYILLGYCILLKCILWLIFPSSYQAKQTGLFLAHCQLAEITDRQLLLPVCLASSTGELSFVKHNST